LFFASSAPKKAMVTMMLSPFFYVFWLQRTKEGDDSCHYLFFLSFACSALRKAMAATITFFFVLWLQRNEEGPSCFSFIVV
jgi:hypothetical protein